MSHALEKVAKEVGLDPDLGIPAVAIAYVMQKTPYVFPIVGGRKVEHLMANIEALKISLSDEQIKYLESILPLDLGFPLSMIVSKDCLFIRPRLLIQCRVMVLSQAGSLQAVGIRIQFVDLQQSGQLNSRFWCLICVETWCREIEYCSHRNGCRKI